jgi:Fe(3+) dicitrate transport protein
MRRTSHWTLLAFALVPLGTQLLLPVEGEAQRVGEVVVTGVVRGTDALPIAGGRVTLTHEGTHRVIATLTDRSGRFRTSAPAGRYTLRIVAPGHAPYERTGVEVGADPSLSLEATLAGRPYALPSVVVVGEALEGVPGSTAVVTAADLRARAPADVRGAVRHVPGVQVMDEDAFGLNLNIGIRGLDSRRSSRVLLLEDGVPIHLAPYSDPSAHYHPPVETLDRIEVLKGSGQILHGPQTVGGVINFVRQPVLRTTGGSVALVGGGSRFRSGHLRAGIAGAGRSLTVDAIRKQGDGVRAHQSHVVQEVGARAGLDLGRGHAITVRAAIFTENSRFGEAGLTQAEFESAPFENAFRNDVFDLTRLSAHAIHTAPLGGAARLTTSAYLQSLERTSWRQANSSGDRFGVGPYGARFACRVDATGPEGCGNQGRPRDYRFAGIEPRLAVPYTLGTMRAELQMGARFHAEQVRRRQISGDTPDARDGTLTRDNSLDTDAVAAFLHNRVELGPWSFSPGVRLERVSSHNRNRMDGSEMRDSYLEFLPGAGITFGGLPRTTLFAGLHRGFAPPRPADVLSPEAGRALVRVDAETSTTAEVGVRARPSPALAAEITWFRIDFRNQVIEGGLVGGGQRFVNAGRTLHAGVEAAGSLSLAGALPRGHEPFLSAGVVYLPVARFRSQRESSVEAGVQVLGNRLPFTPRALASAAAGYRNDLGLEARLEAEHVSTQFADDVGSRTPSPDGQRGPIPSHTVFHATVTQAIQSHGLTLFVSATNLTDRLYMTDRREGIMVGAPRLVRAGMRWGF